MRGGLKASVVGRVWVEVVSRRQNLEECMNMARRSGVGRRNSSIDGFHML